MGSGQAAPILQDDSIVANDEMVVNNHGVSEGHSHMSGDASLDSEELTMSAQQSAGEAEPTTKGSAKTVPGKRRVDNAQPHTMSVSASDAKKLKRSLPWSAFIGENEFSILRDPKGKLNDSIISVVGSIIEAFAPNIQVLPSSVLVAKTSSPSATALGRTLRQNTAQLPDLKVISIIGMSDHWACLVLNPKAKEALVINSIPGMAAFNNACIDIAEFIICNLLAGLQGDNLSWKYKNGWMFKVCDDLVQDDGCNCGVYALAALAYTACQVPLPAVLEPQLWRAMFLDLLSQQGPSTTPSSSSLLSWFTGIQSSRTAATTAQAHAQAHAQAEVDGQEPGSSLSPAAGSDEAVCAAADKLVSQAYALLTGLHQAHQGKIQALKACHAQLVPMSVILVGIHGKTSSARDYMQRITKEAANEQGRWSDFWRSDFLRSIEKLESESMLTDEHDEAKGDAYGRVRQRISDNISALGKLRVYWAKRLEMLEHAEPQVTHVGELARDVESRVSSALEETEAAKQMAQTKMGKYQSILLRDAPRD